MHEQILDCKYINLPLPEFWKVRTSYVQPYPQTLSLLEQFGKESCYARLRVVKVPGQPAHAHHGAA